MSFHEIRFPTELSAGATGGPERRTEIVQLTNGFEERNTSWAQSRRRFDAGTGMRTLDDLDRLIAFFEARRGRLHAFRWKDSFDWRSARPTVPISAHDQIIGEGDEVQTVFQLSKTYYSGQQTETRPITKPVFGSVLVAVDGVELVAGTDFTADSTTGLVSLSQAPHRGEVITAGYEYDVPVRFDTDYLDISLESYQAGQVPSVPVVEVRV